MYNGHPVRITVLESDCIKANVGLGQLSLSAELLLDRHNEMRAITKLFLKIQLTLLDYQSSRTDVVPLKTCHQFKLLRGAKRKRKNEKKNLQLENAVV